MNKGYLLFWVFIVLGTFLESVGDISFRYATTAGNELYRWAGYLVYIAGSAAWAISLKYHELTKGLVVFIAVNVLMVAIASKYIFLENLTATQLTGVFLVILGIFFVEA
jgi:hypothetical protein